MFCLKKNIINLDSLHQNIDEKILAGLCNFIQSGNNKNIEWSDWVLYSPQDTPSQLLNGKISGSCGVHVCTWAYIVASGTYIHLSEKDMNTIRKGIANFLINAEIDKAVENRIIKARDQLYNSNSSIKTDHKFKAYDYTISKKDEVPLGFLDIYELWASLRVIIECEKCQPKTRSNDWLV